MNSQTSHLLAGVAGFVAGGIAIASLMLNGGRESPAIPAATPTPVPPSYACRINDAASPGRAPFVLEVGSTVPGERRMLALTCTPTP